MEFEFNAGQKVRMIFSGAEVVIVGEKQFTSLGKPFYIIRFDNGNTATADSDTIAAETDPFFIMVQKCKAEMITKGYTCLTLAKTKEGRWFRVYFTTHEEYQRIVKKYPDLKFRYYWSTNEKK
jgi:hypothetical protein